MVERLREITSGTPDRIEAATLVARAIRSAYGYRWTGVYEVGDEDIYVLGWDGPHEPAHPRFPKTGGLCGRAAASRAAVRVDDVTEDPNYLTTLETTRSEVVVPVLNSRMEAIGLIDVESEHVNAFSAEDVSLLSRCASAAAALWS